MSRTLRFPVVGGFAVLLLGAAAVFIGLGGDAQHAKQKRELLAAYGHLPLSFERNAGQADPSVRFISRGAGYALGLTERGTLLSLTGRKKGERAVLRSEFVGARPDARIAGAERRAGRVNYLTGDDRRKWKTGVPTYGQVANRRVWDGIDVVYYGDQGRLEYDYRLAAGADPAQIQMQLTGARRVRLDRSGNLVISVPGGTVRQLAPKASQTIGGARRSVASRYVLHGNRVGVAVGRYDHRRPLVIDPVLAYSTYLGGESLDTGTAIAVDADGNAYVTGRTGSTDFATTDGAFQSTHPSVVDAFVTKLNPDGTELVYSTYLGGDDTDLGYGIAVNTVDADPNDDVPAEHQAYVTGRTYSSNFPTTPGAIQGSNATNPGAGTDAFVAALDDTGGALKYSTYLGGTADDTGAAIAVDSEGSAYVAGDSNSTNFPTTGGAIQGTNGGGRDGFVAKLNATGTTLTRSSYFGGGGFDAAYGIAIDATGRAYVSGTTDSDNLPTSGAAFQTTPGGGADAFVLRLEPSGSAISYLTYLGGSNSDSARAIAVDTDGAAYLTGDTISTNFPTTAGAFATAIASSSQYDAYVTKLTATGSALAYSTYLGGSLFDTGAGIGVDSEGIAHVSGQAFSADFPTTDEAAQPARGGGPDAFVTAVDATGAELSDSTYLGGDMADGATAIAVSPGGDAFVTGQTASSTFPSTAGSVQTAFGGGSGDAFVAVATSRHPTTVSTTCGAGSVASGAAVSCSARVTDTSSDEPSAPTGDVSFSSSASGTFGSGGTCTLSGGAGATSSCPLSYTPSAGGTHTVTAAYGGDGLHSPGTGTAVLAVTSGAGGGGSPTGGPAGGGTGGNTGGDDDDGMGGGGGAPATVTADDLGFSPKTFRAAGSGPSAKAAKARPIGTRVTYKLNVAASVRFTVARRAKGRKVRHGKGKKAKTTCDKTTRKNRKKKLCTRYATLKGSFRLAGKPGTNSFRFTGRLNDRKLAPGRYQLTAAPRITGKAVSPAKAAFTIVR